MSSSRRRFSRDFKLEAVRRVIETGPYPSPGSRGAWHQCQHAQSLDA